MKKFRENFKFNPTDPAITPGKHDWNVFVARKLKFNFLSSVERFVFLEEGWMVVKIRVCHPREELGSVSGALEGARPKE